MENINKFKNQSFIITLFFIIFFGSFITFYLRSFDFTKPNILLSNEIDQSVGDLIPASLKRVKDYPSELEKKSLEEIIELSKGSGDIEQKAKKIKKLVEQQKRLKEKY